MRETILALWIGTASSVCHPHESAGTGAGPVRGLLILRY